MKASEYLRFHSDLFTYEQPDETIDQYYVGGDCLEWFYQKLLSTGSYESRCEPVMEDWGWYASLTSNKQAIELLVYGDYNHDHYWVLGFVVKKGRLFMRSSQDQLDLLLSDTKNAVIDLVTNKDINDMSWHNEFPA